MQVLGDVRTELRTNPDDYADAQQTIISIVQAGEAICQSLGEGNVAPVSVPGAETATPGSWDSMTGVTATP